MESLRRNEAAHLPTGITGYCWGGKHVVSLAEGFTVDGKPLIDAGFTAHPSFLTLFDDIEKMTIPVSFAVGDKDNMVSPEQVSCWSPSFPLLARPRATDRISGHIPPLASPASSRNSKQFLPYADIADFSVIT